MSVRHALGLARLAGLLFCTAAGLAHAAAATCSAQSLPHRTALVELYTSEGCNSCPPADAWLRQFQGQPAASALVPLALHVDYWNSEAWTDRFSDARYSARQNWLAARGHTTTIYTPEVFVNGREARNWRGGGVQDVAAELARLPAEADLSVTQSLDGHGGIEVSASASERKSPAPPLGVFIAVYQNNIDSQVKAGENSGATLHHAFATRLLSTPGAMADGRASSHLAGRLPEGARAADLGVVAFAQNLDTGEVLQAVSMPLCAVP